MAKETKKVEAAPVKKHKDEVKARLTALIRASVPVIYVRCPEELRFEKQLLQMALKLEPVRQVRFHSVTCGVTEPHVKGKKADDVTLSSMGERVLDGQAVTLLRGLEWAMNNARNGLESGSAPTILVMRDTSRGIAGNDVALRSLRDAIRTLRSAPVKTTVIMLSPTNMPPDDARAEVGFVDWPLPDEEDRVGLLASTLNAANYSRSEDRQIPAPENGELAKILGACAGLTAEQMSNAIAVSIAESNRVDADAVLSWKAEEVRKLGLEYIEPDPTLEVGGLDNLRKFLDDERALFTPKAREYGGLRLPRGIFLAGISGTGKSLCARYCASRWGYPLIRLDNSMLLGSHVGESEAKTAAILRNLTAMAPCVVMLDEVEKVFSGAGSAGARSDGGTKRAVFGQFLTWLAEQEGCFVVATANDIETLVREAPEFVNKHRFDEIFFVNLPTPRERKEIAAVHIKRRKRNPADFDLNAIAGASENLSGAEIESAIQAGLVHAFMDGGREPTTADFVYACQHIVPLVKTASAAVHALKEWAKGRCQLATTPEETNEPPKDEGEVAHRNIESGSGEGN
jgi:ATP-dependent 26S proteasome regulatory subunit